MNCNMVSVVMFTRDQRSIAAFYKAVLGACAGMKPIVLALAAAALAGCAASSAMRCPPNERAAINELIYFGTGTPDGAVTEAQWGEYLRDVVTPRFPQGLTTWCAAGQWRSQDGSLTREDSYVLNLVHREDGATEKAVQELIETYKQRFRQEAVLRVKTPSCTSL